MANQTSGSGAGAGTSASGKGGQQGGQGGQGGGQGQGGAAEAAAPVKQAVQEGLHDATEAARTKAQQAAETVARQGREAVERQKHMVSSRIHELGQALNHGAERLRSDADPTLANYVAGFASRFDDAADYVDSRDVNGMMSDVEDFTHRHPEWVYGGLFLAGLAVARFLKASRRRYQRSRFDRQYVFQGGPRYASQGGGQMQRSAQPYGSPGYSSAPTGQPYPAGPGHVAGGPYYGSMHGVTPLRPEDDMGSTSPSGAGGTMGTTGGSTGGGSTGGGVSGGSATSSSPGGASGKGGGQ